MRLTIRTPLQGHIQVLVASMAFSPMEETVISASSDQTVLLWDLVNLPTFGEPLNSTTSRVHGMALAQTERWNNASVSEFRRQGSAEGRRNAKATGRTA